MNFQTSRLNKTRAAGVASRMAIFGPIAANVAFVMELTLVPLLLPAIQRQFGLSMGDLGWVFNSYGFAVAIGVLFGGWLGDAFYTRKVFGGGVALFAAGSLLSPSRKVLMLSSSGVSCRASVLGSFRPLCLCF